MFRGLIFLIAFAIVAAQVFHLVWPVIDSERELLDGSYRGIEIGSSKAEVLGVVRSSNSALRLSIYYVEDRGYVVPSLSTPAEPLSASNKWALDYPGIHKETVVLTFDDDRVVSIRYRRDALAP
jgi:hypothetical protein